MADMAGDLVAVARKGTISMKAPSLAAAAALFCVMGCSDLDPASQTYQQVYQLEPELPPNWRCLNEARPAPPMPAKPMFSYTAFVPDYRTLGVVPVSARACLITDFACDVGFSQGVPVQPLRPGTPPGFSVTVPATFEGFVRLTAENYLTFDYYIGGPMLEDVVATQPFSMVSQTSAAEFLTGLGADPRESAGLGILAVQVFDCNRDFAPNVTLILPDLAQQPALQSAEPFATQDRIPVANRPTDAEGIAGFINLPTVNLAVEAEVMGKRFGLRSFRIQPGRLTSGAIRPNYDVGY